MYNLYNLSQTGKNIYEEAVNECAHEYGEAGWMISFLEMAQQYPIGAKVCVPGEDGPKERQREITGYEYYNGTGYLLFRDREKVDVERLTGIHRVSVR